NNRTVALNLAATDPLIAGVPGTSSGVTQAAVDIDADGTFPCSILFNDPNPDFSGCAANFNPATPATLSAGDGTKKVGVVFGDGARQNTRPCAGLFCVITLGSPILGNVSAAATDEILLDTVKPIALATQSAFTVDRGGSVSFDSTTSVDQNPPNASGVDPASATWQFKDGTPQATGAKVTHVFNQPGTFVGDLRVRDRAGNLSDIRQFAVTVNPGPGGSSVGTLRGITGTAAFNLDRLRVSARYVRSRLKGSIILSGSAAQAGALRAELRRSARGRLLGKIVAKRLKVGAFTRTLKLPESLLPGTYRLAFVGPGGTLRTTLTLKAPREGVIRSGRISGAGVLFRFAAQPVKALRGKLTVAWSQGSRSLGTVPVASGASIRAALPGGATLGGGRLRAVLRAGGTVVGSATTGRR
ncbi:MAG: PKD domain-containing protein, partial [Thermoleophilia bacterium]